MLIVDPDHILPAQLRHRPQCEPEHKLCAAVLEEAILCFQKNLFAKTKQQRRLFLDAEQWFRNNRTRWPFSFLSVCEVLGLDPNYVRQGLLQWKRQVESSQAAANPPGVAETGVGSFDEAASETGPF